jgi:hypothetical protein
MITPAHYDITVLQDSTWKRFFRVTQNLQELSGVAVSTGTPTFEKACHDLSAGDRVVFTSDIAKPLCGLELNVVYFVIATGLTDDEFQVSATNGGTSIAVSGTLSGSLFVSEPIDLTGYSIDSDVVTADSSVQVATLTPTITENTGGGFELVISAATSKKLIAGGGYKYDVALISPGGERYYPLTGNLNVRRTFSRA